MRALTEDCIFDARDEDCIKDDEEIDLEYFPNDGYDYSQHIFDPAKFQEEYFGFVAPAPNLKELRADPVFRGELERDPTDMDAEERALVELLRGEEEDVESERDSNDEAFFSQLVPTAKERDQICEAVLWNKGKVARRQPKVKEGPEEEEEWDEFAEWERVKAQRLAEKRSGSCSSLDADAGELDFDEGGEDLGSDFEKVLEEYDRDNRLDEVEVEEFDQGAIDAVNMYTASLFKKEIDIDSPELKDPLLLERVRYMQENPSSDSEQPTEDDKAVDVARIDCPAQYAEVVKAVRTKKTPVAKIKSSDLIF